MKNNRFFRLALHQATRLKGKPARIGRLIFELTLKVSRADWSASGRTRLKQQTLQIGRLIKASLTGGYRFQSPRLLVALLAACIYFVNPLDLVPDVLPAIGLADDMTILAWVVNTASEELLAFDAWEKQKAISALL
ncbi:MAG: DUF1232 domain-containing protein [Cyclobacteriaceae bacterium]|nr:DUF1232 domain-containing protein [Cyclobacteriaceae bacterium]